MDLLVFHHITFVIFCITSPKFQSQMCFGSKKCGTNLCIGISIKGQQLHGKLQNGPFIDYCPNQKTKVMFSRFPSTAVYWVIFWWYSNPPKPPVFKVGWLSWVEEKGDHPPQQGSNRLRFCSKEPSELPYKKRAWSLKSSRDGNCFWNWKVSVCISRIKHLNKSVIWCSMVLDPSKKPCIFQYHHAWTPTGAWHQARPWNLRPNCSNCWHHPIGWAPKIGFIPRWPL